MKKLFRFLLKKYAQMTGDRKVRLGLGLSKMVREVRKSGMRTMGA